MINEISVCYKELKAKKLTTIMVDKEINYYNYFNEVQYLIKAGKVKTANKMLLEVSNSKIPSPYISLYANLLRRTGHNLKALKILHPRVYPKDKYAYVTSDSEKLEYAATLIKLGMNIEGLSLAENIDTSKHPQILIHSAFAHFSQWNYEKAIPILEFYINNFSLTLYQNIVARVNLASAYLMTNHLTRASEILDLLLKETYEESNLLLFANCLEMKAQLLIKNKSYKEAQETLIKTKPFLKETSLTTSLLLKKWEAVCSLFLKNEPKNIKALRRVREKSVKLSNWETTRHCDLFLAKFTKNKNLANYLYHGSPSYFFKEYIKKEIGSDFLDSALRKKQIKWPYRARSTQKYNFSKFEKENFSRLPKILIQTLMKDFYRPLRTYELFDLIYKNERFNPESSPNKIYQLVNRTQALLNLSQVPLEIIFQNNYYRLTTKQNYSIQIDLT